MGEIKSTLDLVMEKTRHLSMTTEEKERQKESDFTRRLQGLLQQYADGAFSAESLLKQVSELAAGMTIAAQGHAAQTVIGRIDPERGNDRWFDVLAELAPGTVDPLRKILAEHRKKRATLLQSAGNRLVQRLSQHHGIEGSAVIPNPHKDSACLEALAALQAETKAAIDAISAVQIPGKRK